MLLLVLTLHACGGSPAQPTPDPPAPTLTCPADISAPARNAQPPTVTFDLPAAQGGVAPVTVACTPASGATFEIGTTRVTCTATDAKTRTGSCSFAINVAEVPRLSQVKFVAFGDSLTEGKTYPAPTGELVLTETESYPFKLQGLLTARYVDQTITVVNAGFAGESVVQDGEERAKKVLDAQRPNVLLLLHGANDLLTASDKSDVIPDIVNALEDIVEAARARGVQTMVATFPPQNGNGSRGSGASAVPGLNDRIRQMAAEEGAILVDLYAGFGGTTVGFVSIDGLHMIDAGYTKMAEIWFDAIRQHFETPPATGGAPVLTIVRPGDRVTGR